MRKNDWGLIFHFPCYQQHSFTGPEWRTRVRQVNILPLTTPSFQTMTRKNKAAIKYICIQTGQLPLAKRDDFQCFMTLYRDPFAVTWDQSAQFLSADPRVKSCLILPPTRYSPSPSTYTRILFWGFRQIYPEAQWKHSSDFRESRPENGTQTGNGDTQPQGVSDNVAPLLTTSGSRSLSRGWSTGIDWNTHALLGGKDRLHLANSQGKSLDFLTLSLWGRTGLWNVFICIRFYPFSLRLDCLHKTVKEKASVYQRDSTFPTNETQQKLSLEKERKKRSIVKHGWKYTRTCNDFDSLIFITSAQKSQPRRTKIRWAWRQMIKSLFQSLKPTKCLPIACLWILIKKNNAIVN